MWRGRGSWTEIYCSVESPLVRIEIYRCAAIYYIKFAENKMKGEERGLECPIVIIKTVPRSKN